MRERLICAKIMKPRGLKGDVRLLPYAEETERFLKLRSCQAVRENGELVAELKISKADVHENLVFLHFSGYDSREAVENLCGLYLSVTRQDALSLSENKWFVCDLEGCEVYDQKRGLLGHVHEVLSTPADDLLLIRLDKEKDLLFPFRQDFLISVDTAEARIDVRLPDGLYEVYRS